MAVVCALQRRAGSSEGPFEPSAPEPSSCAGNSPCSALHRSPTPPAHASAPFVSSPSAASLPVQTPETRRPTPENSSGAMAHGRMEHGSGSMDHGFRAHAQVQGPSLFFRSRWPPSTASGGLCLACCHSTSYLPVGDHPRPPSVPAVWAMLPPNEPEPEPEPCPLSPSTLQLASVDFGARTACL